jgi:CheY-like chemotaxis protein
LLEMHGGSVEAESAGANAGSTFIVRLPLAETAEMAANITVPAASRRAHRILIVDDNNDAAETLSMLLSLEGHATCVANDGESALTAAKEFRPDTVFLDIGLPGMNGYETARHLREAHGRLLRLVALTGWGTEEDRQRAHDAGFDCHLVKPVDPAMLASALQ